MASFRPYVQSVPYLSQVRRAFSASVLLATLSLGTWAAADPRPEDLMAADAPSRGTANVSPEVAQKAASIARQTMSPFCPGRTLADCPSPSATEWRKEIRAMVAAGMSAAEIQSELEKRAGGNLSGSPNRETSWTVPLFLSIAAAFTLYLVFSRLRPRPSAKATAEGSKSESKPKTPKATPAVDDSRLAEELENEEV